MKMMAHGIKAGPVLIYVGYLSRKFDPDDFSTNAHLVILIIEF